MGGPHARMALRLLAVAALGGCAMPHAMERSAPAPGSSCPTETFARGAEPPVDTTRLEWYRAADPRDVELGLRWCETVGEPLMRLTPTVGSPSWREAGGVDVVTWNMEVGAGDLYAFLDQELGLDCSVSAPSLRPGARPFVLLLQEAWRYSEALPPVEDDRYVPWTFDYGRDGADNPTIDEAADRCGLAYLYVASARNGPDTGSRPHEDKGNAVLSTLPLTTPIAIDLPHEAGRKVAVAATIVSPQNERVRLVSVHLDVASTLVRTLFSGNQTRVRQTQGLVDAINEAERTGPVTGVVVVGGDFNTWVGNEASLKIMRGAFPESPRWDGLPTRKSYPTDHVFFRRGSFGAFELSGYERIEERYGSDHHGRRVTLTRTPSAS